MIMEICILWSTPFHKPPITGNNLLSLAISISPINHFWLLHPGDYLHLSIGYRVLYMHYMSLFFPPSLIPPLQLFHLSWRALLSLLSLSISEKYVCETDLVGRLVFLLDYYYLWGEGALRVDGNRNYGLGNLLPTTEEHMLEVGK